MSGEKFGVILGLVMMLVLTVVFGILGLRDIVVFRAWGVMVTETLAAVPLFIFEGLHAGTGRLMERLFRGFQFSLPSFRARLASACC